MVTPFLIRFPEPPAPGCWRGLFSQIMLEELPGFQGLGSELARGSLPVTLPHACSWQVAWSKPRAGSSLPFQWLKSPGGLRREKGVLQTLGQPCRFLPLPQGGSGRLQLRGCGVSLSA